MAKIVITGGAGFIGSYFTELCLFQEHQVLVIDNLTYAGNMANLQRAKGFKFLKADIADPKIEKAIKGYNYIVNMAAESHVDRSIDDCSPFIWTNVFGTANLLKIALKHKIKRFLQVSTDEVYGSIAEGSFSETSPLNPTSPYAASKAAADMLALSFHKTFGLDVVITRSCNNFGPRQYPEKLIPLFVKCAVENKPMPLFADGKNRREWIYVIDNCDAIYSVLLKGRKGQIYNISANFELESINIARQICASYRRPRSLIKSVQDRPGHDFRYSVSCEAIKRDTGWEPRSEDIQRDQMIYTIERRKND